MFRTLSLVALFLVGIGTAAVQACDQEVGFAPPPDKTQPVTMNGDMYESGMPTAYSQDQNVEVQPAYNAGFDEQITQYQNMRVPDRLNNADKATIGKPAVQYRVNRDMQNQY